MWQNLGKLVIKFRLLLLILFFSLTGLMGYFASQVKLSYEFSKAIPTDNPRYLEYLSFKKQFGDDGNMLVIGIQTKDFFKKEIFTAYQQMEARVKNITGVDNILSIPGAVTLVKDSVSEKLHAIKIF